MSKFKPGDRVRHKRLHFETATILAVHEGRYWVEYDDGPSPIVPIDSFDRHYRPVHEPFLPDGEDRYHNYYHGGHVGTGHSSLAEAVLVFPNVPKLGVIRVNGQTGELSWVKMR